MARRSVSKSSKRPSGGARKTAARKTARKSARKTTRSRKTSAARAARKTARGGARAQAARRRNPPVARAATAGAARAQSTRAETTGGGDRNEFAEPSQDFMESPEGVNEVGGTTDEDLER